MDLFATTTRVILCPAVQSQPCRNIGYLLAPLGREEYIGWVVGDGTKSCDLMIL